MKSSGAIGTLYKENSFLARFTLVFDREECGPAFFREMWKEHRIACMTYNKYPKGDWPEHEFEEQTGTGPNGQEISMMIAERRESAGKLRVNPDFSPDSCYERG